MIERLQNNKAEVSKQIHLIFQSSYAVEAKLLNAFDFPPLKRPIESYLTSDNQFFGYLENNEIAGIIEIENKQSSIDINSLVVDPKYFRRGIARQLLDFVLDQFDSTLLTVETGVNNGPASILYRKMGFEEIKQWDTEFGIRKVLFEKRIKD